jgi:Protein of unknown function (DUF1761)
MRKINYKAVAAATLAAFTFSSLYYSPLLLGNVWNELRGIHPSAAAGTPIWKPIIEFVRTLIVAYVFARFIALLGISDWKSAICFGLGIWVCFPVMILTGSVMWENVPLGVAAIHAGDWLVKALFFSVVFSMWHPRQEKEQQG